MRVRSSRLSLSPSSGLGRTIAGLGTRQALLCLATASLTRSDESAQSMPEAKDGVNQISYPLVALMKHFMMRLSVLLIFFFHCAVQSMTPQKLFIATIFSCCEILQICINFNNCKLFLSKGVSNSMVRTSNCIFQHPFLSNPTLQVHGE